MQAVNAAHPVAGTRGHTTRHWSWSPTIAAGAIGAVTLTHLIDFGVYHLRYRILNANTSASWSHGVAAAALAVGAGVCAAGAWRLERERTAWLAAAAMLALLFADEVSGLHARIDALPGGKLLYAPLLVALVLCVWRVTRDTVHRAGIRASVALLLASYSIHVLGPHNIARWLGWAPAGWAFQSVVALKEGTELAGLLVALLALWGAAFTTRARARERR